MWWRRRWRGRSCWRRRRNGGTWWRRLPGSCRGGESAIFRLHASPGCPASSLFRPGLAPRKDVEAILVVPEIVLRLELDSDPQLATFDVHLLATLHPRVRHTTDPVEDLIPARFELSVVEAGQSAFEYGLKASELNRGSVKAR